MLSPALEGVRLSLHVAAAAVWVGGQITLAGLVPSLRPMGSEAVGVVARQFARIAWPAFAVLVLTGFWNLAAVHLSEQSTAWQAVLGVKLAVVLVSGLSVLLHQRARSRTAVAIFGAVSGVSATAALVLGVFLAG
jgi:putative copper export protein